MGIDEDNGEIVGADGEIALTVNDIERLVITKPDRKKFNSLIERLKCLSEQFPENVGRYISEIRGVVEVTMEYYEKKGVKTPDIGFLDNYGK